jgi:hypothetical protein
MEKKQIENEEETAYRILGMLIKYPGEVAGLPKIDGFRWLEILKKATIKS